MHFASHTFSKSQTKPVGCRSRFGGKLQDDFSATDGKKLHQKNVGILTSRLIVIIFIIVTKSLDYGTSSLQPFH